MNVLEISKQFYESLNLTDTIYPVGITIFAIWLLQTSYGRRSLDDSAMRRNNMQPFLPFLPFFIWFASLSLSTEAIREVMPNLSGWKSTFADNLAYCGCAIISSAIVIYIAEKTFVKRLKGFGLDLRTIPKDFAAACVNLVSVWPVMMLVIMFTIVFGKLLVGPSFEMEPHEELKVILTNPELPLRVIVLITTVVVVPFFEEIFFRGMFQTTIRSFLVKPWPSIVISSLIFSMIHANPQHWAALFVLSMCLGYSYEKSGSLFRPIFIHSLFNATSIIGTLAGG